MRPTSKMTIGGLTTQIVLDEPGMVYCGSDQEITGHVSVGFFTRQAMIRELFGPMEVAVILTGRSKTKIIRRHNNGNSTSSTTYRGRAPLVSFKYIIHQGPVRIQHREHQQFQFAFRFPDKVQALQTDRFDADPRFDTALDGPLPPSMHCNLSHNGECFIEYRVNIAVSMPSIDLQVTQTGDPDGQIVYYEQARVPAAIAQAAHIRTQQDIFRVSNELLLPEDLRPQGFREKTKAFFKSDAYPTFVCVTSVNGIANLLLNEPLKLTVRAAPNMDQTTAQVMPEIKVYNPNITIRAITEARAETRTFSSKEEFTREKLLYLATSSADRRIFSKANDWTKEYSTQPLIGIPTTFSTFNISRTYTMSIEIVVEIASKTNTIKFKDIPVRVMAPAIQEAPPMPVASSSAAVPSEELPTYEAPPAYDEKD